MTLATPRLARLAAGAQGSVGAPAPGASTADDEERCDLCAQPIPETHRHLIDLESRRILCACIACRILFDSQAAGGGHYRLAPERRLKLEGFELDEALWEELRIPVDMAFFFHSTPVDRVVALYPGPMGATESLLELAAWDTLERANPVLKDMEPDVEALLAYRVKEARDHYLVPVDDCYRLVGLIRTRWKGLAGGREVWDEIQQFFDALTARSETVKPEEAA